MAFVRKPRIGELNRRVKLQTRADSGNASGGIDTAYTTVAEVWAKVSAESGGLVVDGQQESRVATHRVTIRARALDWNSILWGEVRLRIISMAFDDSRQFIEILCEAQDGV